MGSAKVKKSGHFTEMFVEKAGFHLMERKHTYNAKFEKTHSSRIVIHKSNTEIETELRAAYGKLKRVKESIGNEC